MQLFLNGLDRSDLHTKRRSKNIHTMALGLLNFILVFDVGYSSHLLPSFSENVEDNEKDISLVPFGMCEKRENSVYNECGFERDGQFELLIAYLNFFVPEGKKRQKMDEKLSP